MKSTMPKPRSMVLGFMLTGLMVAAPVGAQQQAPNPLAAPATTPSTTPSTTMPVPAGAVMAAPVLPAGGAPGTPYTTPYTTPMTQTGAPAPQSGTLQQSASPYGPAGYPQVGAQVPATAQTAAQAVAQVAGTAAPGVTTQVAAPQVSLPQGGAPQGAQAPYQSYQYGQGGQATAPSAVPTGAPQALPPLPSDFDTAVQNNLPLSPDQVEKLHSKLDAVQRAAATLPNPPKAVTGSIFLSLAPGAQPGVIRPFFGLSTSLVVLDSTGAPWPVENFNVGNKTLFDVSRLDGPQGSTFVISPLQMYGQTDLILKLVGNPTPVIIDLVAGQKVVDTRVEARVGGHGPNAQFTSTSLTPGVDSRLLSVLDGVPPQGRPLSIQGDSASRAWLMPNGHVWLRTNLSVISPAPISFVSSADGTRVYELTANARVLGMLNNEFITLDLSGCLQECSGN